MYYKIPYKLVVIVLSTIVVLTIIGVIIVKSGNKKDKKTLRKSSEIYPHIELYLSSDDENQNDVIIYAKASTEDEGGIAAITTPDGNKILKNGENEVEIEYTVNQNDSYTFRVSGNNGKISENTIEVSNIITHSASQPYIPDGFHYVEGDVGNGYIIEDDYGNQYVWVPVESGILSRNKKYDANFEENENIASELVNSVAKYYGFYIARYESSMVNIDGKNVAATMANQLPCTNISYKDAVIEAQKSASVFGYSDCFTALASSYAWDTTLDWININYDGYSSSTQYGNYSGDVRYTGTTDKDNVNGICDLAGNVREWTTECYRNNDTVDTATNNIIVNNAVNSSDLNLKNRVVRGGSASSDRIASSYTAYKENSKDIYWGFRMVLYK